MKYTLRQTKQFKKWLEKTIDRSVKIRVLARLERVKNGNFGDVEKITDDLSELRFHFGSGPRIYYTISGNTIVILLYGGTKAKQSADIKKAIKLLNDLEE